MKSWVSGFFSGESEDVKQALLRSEISSISNAGSAFTAHMWYINFTEDSAKTIHAAIISSAPYTKSYTDLVTELKNKNDPLRAYIKSVQINKIETKLTDEYIQDTLAPTLFLVRKFPDAENIMGIIRSATDAIAEIKNNKFQHMLGKDKIEDFVVQQIERFIEDKTNFIENQLTEFIKTQAAATVTAAQAATRDPAALSSTTRILSTQPTTSSVQTPINEALSNEEEDENFAISYTPLKPKEQIKPLIIPAAQNSVVVQPTPTTVYDPPAQQQIPTNNSITEPAASNNLDTSLTQGQREGSSRMLTPLPSIRSLLSKHHASVQLPVRSPLFKPDSKTHIGMTSATVSQINAADSSSASNISSLPNSAPLSLNTDTNTNVAPPNTQPTSPHGTQLPTEKSTTPTNVEIIAAEVVGRTRNLANKFAKGISNLLPSTSKVAISQPLPGYLDTKALKFEPYNYLHSLEGISVKALSSTTQLYLAINQNKGENYSTLVANLISQSDPFSKLITITNSNTNAYISETLAPVLFLARNLAEPNEFEDKAKALIATIRAIKEKYNPETNNQVPFNTFLIQLLDSNIEKIKAIKSHGELEQILNHAVTVLGLVQHSAIAGDREESRNNTASQRNDAAALQLNLAQPPAASDQERNDNQLPPNLLPAAQIASTGPSTSVTSHTVTDPTSVAVASQGVIATGDSSVNNTEMKIPDLANDGGTNINETSAVSLDDSLLYDSDDNDTDPSLDPTHDASAMDSSAGAAAGSLPNQTAPITPRSGPANDLLTPPNTDNTAPTSVTSTQTAAANQPSSTYSTNVINNIFSTQGAASKVSSSHLPSPHDDATTVSSTSSQVGLSALPGTSITLTLSKGEDNTTRAELPRTATIATSTTALTPESASVSTSVAPKIDTAQLSVQRNPNDKKPLTKEDRQFMAIRLFYTLPNDENNKTLYLAGKYIHIDMLEQLVECCKANGKSFEFGEGVRIGLDPRTTIRLQGEGWVDDKDANRVLTRNDRFTSIISAPALPQSSVDQVALGNLKTTLSKLITIDPYKDQIASYGDISSIIAPAANSGGYGLHP